MVESPGFTEASVLDVINKLHADNPGKVTFGLAEIAEAMAPEQIAAVRAGSDVVLIWMDSLNNVGIHTYPDLQLIESSLAPDSLSSFPRPSARKRPEGASPALAIKCTATEAPTSVWVIIFSKTASFRSRLRD
jgi:hypothetical protein